MVKTKPQITGQWLGHFQYGPEYGDLYGEKVSFSITLEECAHGEFKGRCFELEGVGMNDTIAAVKGYLDGDIIHFVKEYPVDYKFEPDGSIKKLESASKPILFYDGQFDYRFNAYRGTWELEVNLGPSIHGDLLDICTGTWEMAKAE